MTAAQPRPWILDTEAVVTVNQLDTLCEWWAICHSMARYVVSNVPTDTIPLVMVETCEQHMPRAVRELIAD